MISASYSGSGYTIRPFLLYAVFDFPILTLTPDESSNFKPCDISLDSFVNGNPVCSSTNTDNLPNLTLSLFVLLSISRPLSTPTLIFLSPTRPVKFKPLPILTIILFVE